MFHDTPVMMFSDNISMFRSQMTLNIIPSIGVIILTYQATVNYSFVSLVVSVQIWLCKEFPITLITFIIPDSEMFLQMSFIMSRIYISVMAITANVKIIIVNSMMNIQITLKLKGWFTSKPFAFVPVLFFKLPRMHGTVKINITLNISFKTKIPERLFSYNNWNQWLTFENPIKSQLGWLHGYSPYLWQSIICSAKILLSIVV